MAVVSPRIRRSPSSTHPARPRLIPWLIAFGVLIVALRAIAPILIKTAVNHRLNDLPDYKGRVADVDLSLLRGAYRLEGLQLFKRDGETEGPLLAAREIDFSIAWRELVHGKVVSDIVIENVDVTFVRGEEKETDQGAVDRAWQDVIGDIFPIDITHLDVRGGTIRYVDRKSTPRVDLKIEQLLVVATGLRNRPSEKGIELPAHVFVNGLTVGGGEIAMEADLEPLAAKPHFKLNFEIRKVALPALNEFLQAYGNVDVSKGTFETYVEVAAREGRFEGYVKPFFQDVVFRSVEDEHKNIAQRLWEKLVAGAAWIVKNKRRDQVGVRVPFAGDFSGTDIGVLRSIGSTLRHGFVRALTQGLEGSIRPEDVDPAKGAANTGQENSDRMKEKPPPL